MKKPQPPPSSAPLTQPDHDEVKCGLCRKAERTPRHELVHEYGALLQEYGTLTYALATGKLSPQDITQEQRDAYLDASVRVLGVPHYFKRLPPRSVAKHGGIQ